MADDAQSMEGAALGLDDNAGHSLVDAHVPHLRENLVNTIARVIQVIDMETEALRRCQPIDLATFNHQKSHGLLDLMRAMRSVGPASFDRGILRELATLQEKLENNLSALDLHLRAVRQVSALIARAIEDDNSDGTYSASITRNAR